MVMSFKLSAIVGILPAALLLATLTACQELSTPLPRAQPVSRADLPLEPLPMPARRAATPGLDIAPPAPEETVTGTYTFTVPDTVTQVQRQTGNFQQFLLYWGQPQGNDTPFLVITLGQNMQPRATAPDATMQVQNTRTYLLNGLLTREWTGYTANKRPFAEIIAKRPGGTDELHATAIVNTPQQRETAMQILGSINWKQQ